MKKLLQFIFIITLAQFISLQSFAQTNYYGVSGNMVSGDFNNDGVLDDIAAFNTSGELPILTLWTSNSGWIDESEANCIMPFDFLSTKSLNSKIVAGDFDNDGFIDDIASIYEIGHNKTSLTVWINNDGKFSPERWWYGGDFDANQVAQTIVAGDFDSDGFVDDIAAFYDYEKKRSKVFVWKSNGKEFAWPTVWWAGGDFNSTQIQGTIVAGDFDHDGFKDDIAALYDYYNDYTKIFVWTAKRNKFNWPYTWFAQADFAAGNAKNNIIAGDFNNNGFEDNIAALYKDDDNSSSILVFERSKRGFDSPNIWWYGNSEATETNMRLVSADLNSNSISDQITGLSITGEDATLMTWTAENNIFTIPVNNWQGIALGIDNCENDGSCLPNISEENISLYPNPSNGVFSVEIPASDDQTVSITVFNVLGSQVLTIQSQPGVSLPMRLNDFKTGTYVLQITGKNYTVNKNFVIE